MKKSMKSLLSLGLSLALCLGLCVPALAANEDNTLGVAFSASLSVSELNVSNAEQTVTLTVAMNKEVELDSVEFKVNTPDGWTASSPETTYASSGIPAWTESTQKYGWMYSTTGNATGVTELLKTVITIPANAAAGAYTITVDGIKLSSNFAYWEESATVSTTLTIVDPDTSDDPAADGYTVTIADSTSGTAAVEVGDTVTMNVTVNKAVNGILATVNYDTDLFSCTEDTDTDGAIEIESWFETATTTIKTLTFTAKAAGTGNFTFGNANVYTGAYPDFISDAVAATTVTDSVTVTEATVTKYGISVGEITNGTVTAAVDGVAVSQAAEGETVTITVNPNAGYEVNSLAVKLGENPITMTKQADGSYTGTFTMPAAAVSVSVVGVMQLAGVSTAANYVTGYTLVTISGTNSNGYTYDGKPMIKVDDGKYAYLVAGTADVTKVAVAAAGTQFTDISNGIAMDVNGTDKVDFNDAGAAFGCYNLAYDVDTYMAMYLRANVNGDSVVDAGDVDAILG